MKAVLVAGARPNFMKIAPIVSAMDEDGGFDHLLVHTGQHYDDAMSRIFFDELGIPRPDLNLSVGSSSHASQTAEVMRRVEPVLEREAPDLVLVVGDVNSTLACAITAAKLGLPVAHVEAGLRSFDNTMPEEINRKLTDAVSELLFVSEPSGLANLRAEGIPEDRVHFVGNVMIDTLLAHRDRARAREVPRSYGATPGRYAVLTLHRPSNVDRPEVLGGILKAIASVASEVPVLFPVHPRTREALLRSGGDVDAAIPGLQMLAPLGYLDFVGLMADAMVILTDSGGIQEESTVLGIPCLTLRENTERPITVQQGTNSIVGCDPERIVEGFRRVLLGERGIARVPDLWDGGAARRITRILRAWEE